MDLIIEETVKESKISEMPEYVANPVKFLDITQELEKHKLPDSEMTVEIPTQLSRLYYNLLYSICQKTNSYSVGHLFTRNVTSRISGNLGKISFYFQLEFVLRGFYDFFQEKSYHDP